VLPEYADEMHPEEMRIGQRTFDSPQKLERILEVRFEEGVFQNLDFFEALESFEVLKIALGRKVAKWIKRVDALLDGLSSNVPSVGR